MGITIVQKSDLAKKKTRATKALILAGGAVTGGSFKAGGLKALGDYLENFQMSDFDIYVGVSSGSLLAAPLMAGIPPHSILRSFDGTSRHFTPFQSRHFYWPNVHEFLMRPFDFLRKTISARAFPPLASLVPSGLFDNRPIEAYIRENIDRNKLTNDFQKAVELTGKRLYITAMRLDGAERVVFGPDEKNDATISEAVMASTAMPGFYRPARIRGVDYVDGGVQETADIDLAVKKGAELIICYNPFRPYEQDEFGSVSAGGILSILNQIFRAAFHARLQISLQQFARDSTFRGDIILIEPRADDADFFMLNPLSLSNSIRAAKLGFVSVRQSIEERYDEVKAILASYGIRMNKRSVDKEYRTLQRNDVDEHEIRTLLENRGKRKR